jgi:hypothetical protein
MSRRTLDHHQHIRRTQIAGDDDAPPVAVRGAPELVIGNYADSTVSTVDHYHRTRARWDPLTGPTGVHVDAPWACGQPGQGTG